MNFEFNAVHARRGLVEVHGRIQVGPPDSRTGRRSIPMLRFGFRNFRGWWALPRGHDVDRIVALVASPHCGRGSP